MKQVKNGLMPLREKVRTATPVSKAQSISERFPHYFRILPPGTRTYDVYRICKDFDVTNPALQHALKKVLAAGGRGAKSPEQDVKEAILSLQRWLEMEQEEKSLAVKG